MAIVRPSRKAGHTRTHRHTFELAGAGSYRIQRFYSREQA
jgi:hypothetical protein